MLQNVTISLDSELKKAAAKKAKYDGITLSAAIKFLLKEYLNGFWKIGAQPVKLTENGLTEREENEILKISKNMKKGLDVSGPFTDDDYLNHLRKL